MRVADSATIPLRLHVVACWRCLLVGWLGLHPSWACVLGRELVVQTALRLQERDRRARDTATLAGIHDAAEKIMALPPMSCCGKWRGPGGTCPTCGKRAP